MAGVEKELPDGLEGGDIRPLFAKGSGEVKRPREELVFHFPHYQGDTPQSAIYLANYKLIKWYENGQSKLFDLSRDIGERNDLSGKMPERATDMRLRLEQYLKDINARLPVPNPDYDSAKPTIGQRERKAQQAQDRQNRPRGERNNRGQNRGGNRDRNR
jgi:hypothetical protein